MSRPRRWWDGIKAEQGQARPMRRRKANDERSENVPIAGPLDIGDIERMEQHLDKAWRTGCPMCYVKFSDMASLLDIARSTMTAGTPEGGTK